jgi:hypothetical protein
LVDIIAEIAESLQTPKAKKGASPEGMPMWERSTYVTSYFLSLYGMICMYVHSTIQQRIVSTKKYVGMYFYHTLWYGTIPYHTYIVVSVHLWDGRILSI